MATVKLGARREIILPAAAVKRLGLMPGEELEVVGSEKAIVLIPRKCLPKDQAWYYTKEWQQMMEEAFEALSKGEMLGPFESVEEFKRAVKARERVID